MKTLVAATAFALLFGSAVMAQQELVVEGQKLMKANGRNMGGVLSAMAKGDKPYDQAAVDTALAQLDETAKKLPTLYPDSTKGLKLDGDFSVSSKVYDDRKGWTDAIGSFGKTVEQARSSVKDLDTLKAAVPGIAKQCSGCHETFRLKNS